MRPMRSWIGRAKRWLRTHSTRAFLVLSIGTVAAYGAYAWGRALLAPTAGLPEGERNLFGRFVAWPGGTWVAFAIGAIVLGILLVPDGRLEGRWRWLAARTAWWSTLCFAVLQLLDDHLLGQAGTSNPLDLEIPYQDLLEIPVLALLAVVFVGALVTLPFRLVRRRAPA